MVTLTITTTSPKLADIVGEIEEIVNSDPTGLGRLKKSFERQRRHSKAALERRSRRQNEKSEDEV